MNAKQETFTPERCDQCPLWVWEYASCYGIADGYCAETHSRDGTNLGCGRNFPIEEKPKPQKLVAAY